MRLRAALPRWPIRIVDRRPAECLLAARAKEDRSRDRKLASILLVDDVERRYGKVTIRVREERKWETQLVDHRRVLAGRVDIDGKDTYPEGEELFVMEGDADQLPVAVRSPISPKEEQQKARVIKICSGNRRTRLIEKCEIGNGHEPILMN